ncbi:MAG: leucine-rich repeat domain-containing protein [Chitinophagaceae bacterium]|nr:leucine-rich repeat domain-containing protein [Chitinophagaceae bacterium]
MKSPYTYSWLILFTALLSNCQVNQHKKAEPVVKKDYSSIYSYSNTRREMKSGQIPDSVWQMTNLRELSVTGMDCDYGGDSCCAVSSLPKDLGNLTNLETLSLTVNAISSIPEEISKLTKLKKLVLDDNLPLKNIEAICSLKQLEHLSLFGCGLQKLPVIIRQLTSLKFIGLTGNPLTENDIEVLHRALPNCEIVFQQ